jgi:hypothetical protein
MTEAEWLTCASPERMLSFVETRLSEREARLFGVACCRRIWHLLKEQDQDVVEIAERFADGEVDRAELDAAAESAWSASSHSLGRAGAAADAAGETIFRNDGFGNVYHVSHLTYNAFYAAGEDAGEYAAQCCLLRDIFGNPFRPVRVAPAWLTSTVVQLASGIYAEPAFDRLPMLADALQDAGCDNANILTHCRGPGPHVRGCWVVDLMLGK